MEFTIERDSAQPLYGQIAHEVRRRIRNGALPAGTRLPTVRELAAQLGVTRLTVHSAYEELQSGGWVEATVGRGTFVAQQLNPLESSDLGSEMSARGLLNDMVRMAMMPGMRSMAMADAAHEFYPTREFARAMNDALDGGPSIYGYPASLGDPLLRTVLAELLHDRGVRAAPDELLITSGATHGLSLIAQTLARPGDTVLVEQPSYLGALNIFGTQGLRIVEIPMDAEGLVVDALPALIEQHQPRFIYTVPTYHNPVGVCLSPARRTALVELAARTRIPVIEDDIYGWLPLDGAAPPAIKRDDHAAMVVFVSSFSKTLLPGLRLGFVAAAPALIARLSLTRQANDLAGPTLLQRAMALYLQRGRFQSHLRRVIPRYRERRDALLTAMTRHFPSDMRWSEPTGGFCVWVHLPPEVCPTDLYLAGIERGVAFAPGDFFFAGSAPAPFMRLSFSTQPPQVLAEAVAVLGELLGTQIARRTITRRSGTDVLPLV
jgi:DNA-binding transcriptional MocR family regulator